MITIILFVIYVFMSSSGLVLFKLGTADPNLKLSLFGFTIHFSIKTLIGVFCYGISFLLWLIIVSRSQLTIVMPLSVALVNTLVVVESCVFLHEKVTLMQGIGIFIVLLGVSLIGVKK